MLSRYYKTKVLLFGIVVLMPALIAGCDALTKAATVKVPITVTVYPKGNNVTIPLVQQDCADLSTNKDYLDNKDRFKDARINKLEGLISQLVNPSFASGSLNDQVFTFVKVFLVFDPIYMDSKVYEIGTISNLSLASVYGPGGGTPIEITKTADADKAAKLILERPRFCFQVQYGPLNTGPATADFIEAKVDITIDFEASAL